MSDSAHLAMLALQTYSLSIRNSFHRANVLMQCSTLFSLIVFVQNIAKKESLLYNNAPSHRSTIAFRIINHSPYSPDSVPCDLYLFLENASANKREALQVRTCHPKKRVSPSWSTSFIIVATINLKPRLHVCVCMLHLRTGWGTVCF